MQNETLSGRIVAEIRGAVLAQQLRSGEFLGSEAALAQRFGVSRMAARDALRTLEGLGIVEIRMGVKGGVWIAEGNPDRLSDALAIHLKLIGVTAGEVFDAQAAIEVMAAELAAERRSGEHLAHLAGIVGELVALKGDLDQFSQAALRFHEGVVEAARSRILLAQFHALGHVLQPVLRPNLTPASAQRIIQRNKQLLAAIADGDGARAAQVMRQRLDLQRRNTAAQASRKPAGRKRA